MKDEPCLIKQFICLVHFLYKIRGIYVRMRCSVPSTIIYIRRTQVSDGDNAAAIHIELKSVVDTVLPIVLAP